MITSSTVKYFILSSFVVFLIVGYCIINCFNDNETKDIEGLIDTSYFNVSTFRSIEVVECQLEDGTTVDCYQITFSGDGVDGSAGPFCPETYNDIGGIAMYDGETNPGLRHIGSDFLDDLESDGWDIMDNDGNVYVNKRPEATSTCLGLAYDADFVFTFTVPVTPKMGSSNRTINEVENLGFSIDGTPFTGNPPSAVEGPAMFRSRDNVDREDIDAIAFPSLDPCGGHPDPAGYYHAHFIPQVMDQVLKANGIEEVRCTLFTQTTTIALAGFAKDGYPIYAYAEEPDDLDDCQGRTGVTDEYPDGVYHYVASTTEAPNMPPCLKGIPVRHGFEFN